MVILRFKIILNTWIAARYNTGEKRELMKIVILAALLALPIFLTSCATPTPPQAFHQIDSNALIIDSTDENTCRMLQPMITDQEQNDHILTKVNQLPQRETAVVILENFSEPTLGDQFRDRSTSLFVALRGAGYKHIVFLQGKGVSDPEGLVTLAKYD